LPLASAESNVALNGAEAAVPGPSNPGIDRHSRSRSAGQDEQRGERPHQWNLKRNAADGVEATKHAVAQIDHMHLKIQCAEVEMSEFACPAGLG